MAEHVRRAFRSLSWGYHEPGGMVLWWLVQPTGHLHILDELAFEQMDEQDVASAIRTKDRQIGIGLDDHGNLLTLALRFVAYTVATPEIVTNVRQKKPGFRGETIGDRLLHYGIPLIPADGDALNGWKRCQSLLQLDAKQRPYLTIDPACQTLTEALQAGLQDPKLTDDVQNPSPALLAFRYGAMSRPTPAIYHKPVVVPPGSPAAIMQRMRLQKMGRKFGEAR